MPLKANTVFSSSSNKRKRGKDPAHARRRSQMKSQTSIHKRPIPSPHSPFPISLSPSPAFTSPPHDVGVVDARADIEDYGERGSNGVNWRKRRPGLMRCYPSFRLLERSTLDLPQVDDDDDDDDGGGG